MAGIVVVMLSADNKYCAYPIDTSNTSMKHGTDTNVMLMKNTQNMPYWIYSQQGAHVPYFIYAAPDHVDMSRLVVIQDLLWYVTDFAIVCDAKGRMLTSEEAADPTMQSCVATLFLRQTENGVYVALLYEDMVFRTNKCAIVLEDIDIAHDRTIVCATDLNMSAENIIHGPTKFWHYFLKDKCGKYPDYLKATERFLYDRNT